MSLNKVHRTLLVKDGESENPTYEERFGRLRQSVGGDNIKVDIAVATKSGVVAEGAAQSSYTADPVEQFRQALLTAKELGYDQVVFSADPNRI